MKSIHDNDVNDISEYNLIYDTLNHNKHNKNMNSNHSHIIHRCMNTHRGKAKN